MPDISKTDILFLSTCLEQLISHLDNIQARQSTRIANRIRMIKKLNNKLLTKISKKNNDNTKNHH